MHLILEQGLEATFVREFQGRLQVQSEIVWTNRRPEDTVPIEVHMLTLQMGQTGKAST